MIPKVIHYLWLSDEKPSDVEQCLATWKEKLVGYEIKEWNKTNFPYQDFLWTREAYSAKKWAFVTDFFRLWVLDNYGGIYMDADITMRGTFDKFLNHPLFVGIENTSKIGAHVIGAIKGHPYIHQCFQYYQNRHFIKEDGSLEMLPIPNVMTKVFMDKYHYDGELVHFDDIPLEFDDMVIYPDTYFTINTYNGNNVCYHNGLGSWRDETTPQNPILENVISNYLIKKFFCNTIFKSYSGWKKVLFLLMPVGLHALMWRYKLKIKNNKRIISVDLSNVHLE